MKHVSLQAGDTSLLHSTLHFRTGMRYLKQLRFQDFFQLQSSGHILCLSQAVRQAICQATKNRSAPVPPDGKAPKTWATKAAPNISPVTLFFGCFGMKNR